MESALLEPPRIQIARKLPPNPLAPFMEPFGATPEDLWTDNIWWAQKIFGITPWPKMEEVFRSVIENKKTVVWSCNSVSKTEGSACLGILWVLAKYPAYTIVTSSSWDTLKQTIMPRMRQKAEQARKIFPFLEPPGTTEWWPYGKNVQHAVICCSPDERENIAGRHNANVFVIPDEASAMKREIMGGIDGITVRPGDRILMPGNPLYNHGVMYEAGTIHNMEKLGAGRGWKLIQISAMDSPNYLAGCEVVPNLVSREWVEGKLVEWANQPEELNPRVFGKPPDETSTTVISAAALLRASEREPKPDAGDLILSVDPTWGGADIAVFALRNDVRLIKLESRAKMKEPDILRRILEYEIEFPEIKRIIVDSSGNPSVGHFLEDQGHPKIELLVYSQRANDAKRFGNTRAEFHYEYRDALDAGFHIPKEYVIVLISQAGIQKKVQTGRIMIESKDQVRERIGRSPDESDAVAQSFYKKAGSAVFETVLAVHKIKRKPIVKQLESGAWGCIPEGAGEFFRPSPGHLERFIWIGENSESCAVWVHVDADGRRIVFDACRSESSTPEFMWSVVARSKGHRYAHDWMSADQGINALWRVHDEIQRLGGTALPDFLKYEQISGAEGVDVLDRLHLGTLSRAKENPFWIGREEERHAHAMRPEWLMYWPDDVLAAMQGARFIGDSGGVNESEKQERIRNGGGGYVRAMRMMAVASLGVVAGARDVA